MHGGRASGIIKPTAALLEFLERPSRRRPPTRERSQSALGHVWRRSERQELSSPQRRSWNFWNFLERTQALKRLHPKATSCTLGGRARLRQTTRGQNLVGEDMTKIHTFGDGGAAGEVRSVSKLTIFLQSALISKKSQREFRPRPLGIFQAPARLFPAAYSGFVKSTRKSM